MQKGFFIAMLSLLSASALGNPVTSVPCLDTVQTTEVRPVEGTGLLHLVYQLLADPVVKQCAMEKNLGANEMGLKILVEIITLNPDKFPGVDVVEGSLGVPIDSSALHLKKEGVYRLPRPSNQVSVPELVHSVRPDSPIEQDWSDFLEKMELQIDRINKLESAMSDMAKREVSNQPAVTPESVQEKIDTSLIQFGKSMEVVSVKATENLEDHVRDSVAEVMTEYKGKTKLLGIGILSLIGVGVVVLFALIALIAFFIPKKKFIRDASIAVGQLKESNYREMRIDGIDRQLTAHVELTTQRLNEQGLQVAVLTEQASRIEDVNTEHSRRLDVIQGLDPVDFSLENVSVATLMETGDSVVWIATLDPEGKDVRVRIEITRVEKDGRTMLQMDLPRRVDDPKLIDPVGFDEAKVRSAVRKALQTGRYRPGAVIRELEAFSLDLEDSFIEGQPPRGEELDEAA